MLIRLRRAAAAQRHALRAVELEPANYLTHVMAAYAFGAGRKNRQALFHATEAVRLAPNNAEAHRARGSILMASRSWNDAESEVRQALELNPNDAVAIGLLADLLDRRGHRQQGQELRLNQLALRPHDQNIQRRLITPRLAARGVLVLLLAARLLLPGAQLDNLIRAGVSAVPGGRSMLGAIVLGGLLLVLVAIFVVSRVLRYRRGRLLPVSVWEGLRPVRRASDFAVVEGIALFYGVIGALYLAAREPVGIVLLCSALAVLGGTWSLRGRWHQRDSWLPAGLLAGVRARFGRRVRPRPTEGGRP